MLSQDEKAGTMFATGQHASRRAHPFLTPAVADRLSDSDLRHLATNACRLRLKRNINRRLALMAESQPDSQVAYFKSAPPDLHFLACSGRNTFRQLLALLERPPYLVDWLGFES
jgi:hypothetical protein